YAVAPRLPIWMQLPTAALGLATVAALREAPRVEAPRTTSHLGRALHIVRFALWRHRRPQAAMAPSPTLGLTTFAVIWLIPPYLQPRGVPPAWLGPFWAAANLWLAGVSLAAARLTAGLGVRATLLGCCLLGPLGYAGLAGSASAWGAVFYLCFMTLRG